MSTKAISKSLEFWAKACPEANAGVEALAGLKELAAIRTAAKVLVKHAAGEYVMDGELENALECMAVIAREAP